MLKHTLIPDPKKIFKVWQSISPFRRNRDTPTQHQKPISTLVLAAAILALGGTALISYGIVRGLLLESLKANAMMQVHKSGDEIDAWLSTLLDRIQVIANSSEVRSMDWSVAEPSLQLERERLPDFFQFLLAKPNGSYYNTRVGFAKGFNISDRLYFKRALAGVANVDDPVLGRTNHIWESHIAVPIWSVPPLYLNKLTKEEAKKRTRNLAFFDLPIDPYQHPKPIGVFSGSLAIKHLSYIISQTKIGEGSYAFALDSKGNAIAHPDSQLIEKHSSLLRVADADLAKISQAMVQREQGIELVKIEGKSVYVAYLPLRQAQWSVAVVIPRDNLEDKLISLNLLASFLGVILVIAIFIAFKQMQLHEQTHIQAQQLARALKELQQTQAQLIQTEKMSSLGQMIAGVAHEINNPVSFIHGNLEYVKKYTQNLLSIIRLYEHGYPKSKIQEESEEIDLEFVMADLPKTLESMKVGTERIRQIVLSLRNFSRKDEADMKEVDIHQGIDSTLLILQNQLKAKPDRPEIVVVKNYGTLPKVECYAGQLNQVFMNIISNAIDAFDNYNKTRSAQEIHDNPNRITIHTEVAHPHWVTIGIADNGSGMAEEVKQRVFDPFFTTKPVGKGTGLGLLISYQIIVDKHGGRLKCFSELGKGTEFLIEIPVQQSNRVAK